MSKPFDYSKWDNIEISDDETEEIHPNIDKESWFRMKHRSRIEREEREEADKKKIHKEMSIAKLRMEEIQATLKSIANDSDSDDELEDVDGLEAELKSLQAANQARQDKLLDYEKNKKWNVDNMCHVVEERTIVNPKAGTSQFSETGYALPDDEEPKQPKVKTRDPEDVDTLGQKVGDVKIFGSSDGSAKKDAVTVLKDPTASEKLKSVPAPPQPQPIVPKTKPATGPDPASVAMLSYHEFTEKYADLCEKFMTMTSLEKSREFLMLHGSILLQENASNYLLLASLEDEMNGFRDKMKLTARQSQLVSNITELAKTMKQHPGNVIMPFFKRLEEREHLMGFTQGLEAFVQNIIKRAVVKKKEIDEEREREAEQTVDLQDIPLEERLGPGGLDPVEVFESLPERMQAAFESRETEELKKALMEMPAEEAEYHMKRCVASGLWNEN